MKVLIIRAGALGDTLMLMPSIRGLRSDHEIIFAGRKPGIDYISPYVNLCLDMDASPWHRLFMKDPDGPLDLPVRAPHRVVAFLNDTEGVIANNLKACFPSSVVTVFPVFPPEADESHIALYMAKAILDAGISIDPQEVMKDSFTYPLMTSKDRHINQDGSVVIHPGSGSQTKNYPPLYWLRLIKELKNSVLDNSKKVVLLLGPAEEIIVNFFKDELGKEIEIKLLPKNEDLLSILGNSSVYVGHDSGVTHLAAMLGKPVIALFKDSSVKRWHPIGPKVRIIKNGDFYEN